MVTILAVIGIIALLVGTFYFVLWMEEWDEKRKQTRLDEEYCEEIYNNLKDKFYNDEDDWDDDEWWYEQGI